MKDWVKQEGFPLITVERTGTKARVVCPSPPSN